MEAFSHVDFNKPQWTTEVKQASNVWSPLRYFHSLHKLNKTFCLWNNLQVYLVYVYIYIVRGLNKLQ